MCQLIQEFHSSLKNDFQEIFVEVLNANNLPLVNFLPRLVARLSQKFPKIEFGELHKIVEDLTKGYKECCHGDLLECADDRVALSEYVCKHKDTISSKLGKCCDKPVIQKSQCIADLENDDIPADLPNFLAEYVETKDACKNYQEANEVYLAHYLYDSGRRHPELAVTTLLRLAKDYEHTLEKCCATADPPACYAKVADDRKAIIEETNHLVKSNCDIFEKLGEYGFENTVLASYTKKLLPLSTPTLLGLAHQFGKVASKCCKLSDQEKVACAEGYGAIVFDNLCRLHEKTPVSDRITKCCTDSLVGRTRCFTAVGDDDTYVPKAFSADTFTFHADLCTLPEEEKQNKKQSVLVELVKHKPHISDEQLKGVITDFTAFVDKCCKAPNQEACFAEDGPKLVASAQAALNA
ncbi:albumin-like [Phascolarctos cinereus]|uniref:Albumin n=1 Tax=Phascolarctos cinereus TaxID=38626 RepID=A0A6P5JX24_PHACI|nr:serum albumin-like [Phascolarctos cinereus]